MQANIVLPKAFSVRDDQELFPIQHLMARLNPTIMVVQVATGRHVTGGCTVFWGLVYLEGQRLTKKDLDAALTEAGMDFGHHVAYQPWVLATDGQEQAVIPGGAAR